MDGKSILIVEDDPFIAMDISQALSSAGVIVTAIASSCDGAFRALEDARPDCVLLDFKLSKEDSTPIADTLDARSIPFVLVTCHLDVALSAIRAQPSGWVRKPFLRADLLSAVAETIGSPPN